MSSNKEAKSARAKAFLEREIVPVLTQALAKMCVDEPDDPYMWLAQVNYRSRNYIFLKQYSHNSCTTIVQYLMDHHPSKQTISNENYHESLVLTLKEGNFFGEIALLSGKPRQATVRASGKVQVLAIGRDAFVRLCGNLVEILQRNISNYSDIELPDEPIQGDNNCEVIISVCYRSI